MTRSPALQISNCVQMKLGWIIGGQGTFNVMHFRKLPTVVVDQTLTNSVASSVRAVFTAQLAPLFPTANGLVRISLRDLTTLNQPEFLDAGPTSFGSSAADSLPPSVAACVTLKTPLAGKSFRGRVYISGFDELQNAATGTAGAGANTAAVNFVSSIRTSLQPLNLFLCVASRPAFGSVTTRVTTFTDGSTESKTLSRIAAKPGGTSDVNLVQARNAGWEQQRRRTNGRGAPPSLAVFEVHL